MIKYIIEIVFGLMCGILMGITGLTAFPLLILIFDYLKVDEYKKIVGAMLFVNLFPISIGSVWEFYKNKKFDFKMGWIILLTTIIGGYLGSRYIVFGKNKISDKTNKYIISIVSFIMAVLFFISAHYEEN